MTDLYTFISTGDKTAMYTLRVMCEVYHPQGSFLKDYYIRNLSTDRDTANQKAHYYSEQLSLPLKSDATFDLNEIKRRRKEELEEIRRIEEEAVRQRAEIVKMETVESLARNVFLVGRYRSLTANEVAIAYDDVQYLEWFANQASDLSEDYFDKFNISANIAKRWLEENPQPKSEYVGEVGERVKTRVQIKNTKTIESFRSTTFLFEMEDEQRNILKTFSVAKSMVNAPKNEWITIEANIKKHEESPYDNFNKVTYLNRPKVVTE